MKKDNRFESIKRQSLGFAQEAIIICDKQTGVQYLFVSSGYAGGLTPLLDKDGKPFVDPYI